MSYATTFQVTCSLILCQMNGYNVQFSQMSAQFQVVFSTLPPPSLLTHMMIGFYIYGVSTNDFLDEEDEEDSVTPSTTRAEFNISLFLSCQHTMSADNNNNQLADKFCSHPVQQMEEPFNICHRFLPDPRAHSCPYVRQARPRRAHRRHQEEEVHRVSADRVGAARG